MTAPKKAAPPVPFTPEGLNNVARSTEFMAEKMDELEARIVALEKGARRG